MLLSLNDHGMTRKYWYKRKMVENLHKKQRQQGKRAEQMQDVVARPVKNQLPFSSCGDSLAGLSPLVGSDPQLEL